MGSANLLKTWTIFIMTGAARLCSFESTGRGLHPVRGGDDPVGIDHPRPCDISSFPLFKSAALDLRRVGVLSSGTWMKQTDVFRLSYDLIAFKQSFVSLSGSHFHPGCPESYPRTPTRLYSRALSRPIDPVSMWDVTGGYTSCFVH